MEKLYSLIIGAAVALSASAATATTAPTVINPRGELLEKRATPALRPQAKIIDSNMELMANSNNTLTPMAELSPSIEGFWDFSLGDYYFNNSRGDITVEFEAQRFSDFVLFTDNTGYELPMIATFDEATGVLTFGREYLGPFDVPIDNYGNTMTMHVYQEPYLYNLATDTRNSVDNLTGVFKDNKISFTIDYGVEWVFYLNPQDTPNHKTTNYVTTYAAYDIYSAVKTADRKVFDEVQEGRWETVGTATFVDAWIMPAYTSSSSQLNPNDYPYEVELQKDVTSDTRYRLWEPFKYSYISTDNQSLYHGQIVFDIQDPDHVIVEAGYPAGFKNREGEFYVYGVLGWQLYGGGQNPDNDRTYLPQIIAFMEAQGQTFDTYDAETKTVYVNKSVFDTSPNCDKAYTFNGSYHVSTIKMNLNSDGVNDIEADFVDGPVRYYNLQGVEIANPAPGSVVIKVQGNTASKLLVR